MADVITHGSCGRSWTGLSTSHCGGCHETFSGIGAFDMHQRAAGCIAPADAGLIARQTPHGVVWRQKGDSPLAAKRSDG